MAVAACPNCGANFEANRHRTYRGLLSDLVGGDVGFSVEKQIAGASRVRCPKCDAEFVSNAVRFFGFLTPRGMLWVVVGYFVAFLLGAIYLGWMR